MRPKSSAGKVAKKAGRSSDPVKVRVLIAEDNQLNRKLLEEMLEILGFAVVVAEDGDAVLELIEKTNPALALIDIQMPKKDGLQVVKEVRAIPKLRDFPMVAVTAYAIRGDRERFLQAGFNSCLAKPFRMSELKKQLSQLLS